MKSRKWKFGNYLVKITWHFYLGNLQVNPPGKWKKMKSENLPGKNYKLPGKNYLTLDQCFLQGFLLLVPLKGFWHILHRDVYEHFNEFLEVHSRDDVFDAFVFHLQLPTHVPRLRISGGPMESGLSPARSICCSPRNACGIAFPSIPVSCCSCDKV